MNEDIIKIVLIFATIIVFKLVVTSPRFKGWIGERIVATSGAIHLDKLIYHQLHNVTLKLADGTTTQIDHVIVSVYGIFVIETKNMKGWIFGNESQKQWTQSLPGGKKFKFQNPLHQNYRHKKALEEFLGIPAEYFYDVIVFAGEATLKTKEELPDCVMTRGWTGYIKSMTEPLLDVDQVDAIVETLEEGRMPSGGLKGFATSREHVQSLRARHSNVDADNPSSDACPSCGGTLVQRTAKRGPNAGNAFLGCSSYPKCRYTRDSG